MELRALGSSGIQVSPMGLGTVKIGRDQQVKYPSGFTIPDDQTVSALIDQAWGLGINLIDTAPAYGNSEERLGKLLPKSQPWVIVTKVGEIFENGESRFDFSAAHTRMSVERSLQRLQRDCVDVVLVHSSGDDMQIIQHEGVFEELEKLKQAGKICAYGMSTKTVEGGLWTVANTDLVMATWNQDDTHDRAVLEAAEQANKGVLIKKGLQSGHAQSVESAMRFVYQQPAVSSMIVGTINPKHLDDNASMVESILSELA